MTLIRMMDSDNLKQILNRIAEDDSAAFGKLYDRYYLKTYRFAGYFIKSDLYCEEIVSDVFFGIWKSRKNLDRIENFEAYLYTTTRNQALHYLHQNYFDKTLVVEELPIRYLNDNETPEKVTIYNELNENLKKAVGELPERCQLIFLMAKEEGLKYREIAQILGVTEQTINTQMVIALKRLAKALRPYLYLLLLLSCLK